MNFYPWFFKSFLILIFCVGLISGCDMLGSLGISSSGQYSLIPTEGLSTEKIPEGDFFYINLSASYYYGAEFDTLDAIIYAMDDGPGTDCKISVNEDSTEDLYCILDIMEGDLFYHKLVLEYNIPPGFCDYHGFLVPYHINQETGNGPGNVYECGQCSGGGANCNSESGCTDASNNCGGADQAGEWQTGYRLLPTGRCQIGVEVNELCPYDKSEEDLGNCCLGSYTLHTASGETETQEWGGVFGQCIGGPGRFAWDYHSKGTGEPITVVTNTLKDGLKINYELDALINVYEGNKSGIRPPSFITANYYKDAEDKDFSASKNNLKVYPDLTGGFGTNPFFVWSCMDKARETKHRIILLIREWSTQTEYNKFKETSGSSGDPDIVGDEGDTCDYFTSDEKVLFIRDSLCNDFLDLDDWRDTTLPTYPEVIYSDSD